MASVGAGADFMRTLLQGYRMVGRPATTAAAPAARSVAEAPNAFGRVGVRSTGQSAADPAGGRAPEDGGSPSDCVTRGASAACASAVSPLPPPTLQKKPVGGCKKGKFRKLPRVGMALPFGTLVISGGTTGMSGTLHRVEDCIVLGRDVQLILRRVDIGERAPRQKNLQGEFVYDEQPVTSRSTHKLSASELHATGGGTLDAFQAARLETSPHESAWCPAIQRLLDQAVYVEYTAGEFPLGDGVPVCFDDFVDYVKGDDCFDLWGDDDDAEAVGRPLPCARGGGAVRSLRACRQLYRG